MSPTIDLAPPDPDAPKDLPLPPLPPDLLTRGAIAAAVAALAHVSPQLAPTRVQAKPVGGDPEDAQCVSCGLSLPSWETECAFCAHAREAKSNSGAEVLRHWLVFLFAMLAVFGAGWLLSP